MTGLISKIVLLVLAALAMASALPPSTEAPTCLDVFCPTSYMPGNYLAPNPHDPCTYCQCVWGRPVVMHCPRHTGWSELYTQCIPSPVC